MMMKKLAIAAAVATMSVGAFAATPLEDELGALLSKFTGGGNGSNTTTTYTIPAVTDPVTGNVTTPAKQVTETKYAPDIAVLSGAVNTAKLSGNIDISGTNVALTSMANNVTAKAEALTSTGGSATSNAYAIAGAKLSTTVIGAMNSATVDVMGKTTEMTDKTTSSLGLGGLSSQGGDVGVKTQSFGSGQLLGLATTGSDILKATSGTVTTVTESVTNNNVTTPKVSVTDVANLQLDMNGLTSGTSTDAMKKVTELQNMSVFASAINVAELDASIKIAATVDKNAWFLNPQTGVVNLSNIEMATTNIGAMNSSLTRLGVNLAK